MASSEEERSISTTELKAEVVTTSVLLSNLHCASCVTYIHEVLSTLHPCPISISPSLVSSWVTVQHNQDLSPRDITEALEDAGFEVCGVTPDDTVGMAHTQYHGQIGYLDRFLDKYVPDIPSSGSKSQRPNRHLENCELCRLEAGKKHRPSEDPSSSKASPVNSHKPMGDQKATQPFVVVDSDEAEDLWRASLAIGGMTCAACVVTITEELEKKDWVKKVAINLISNSATVEFNGQQHKNDIVDSIEDIGYDATIDSVVDLKAALNAPRQGTVSRTVEILVLGMFCEHCPPRIHSSLDAFGDLVKVENRLSLTSPILKITYRPRAPDFTVRNVMAAISSVDAALQPSIYHRPTLEELSQKIHARERKRIFIRVLVTLAVAIPTLIIGIIYMSLVSADNPGRQFLMHPLRAGISRAQWALFIMATPVYFLCADVFHIRALKEVRAMWRRGSTTPISQRFYRFGSMNMLMSLGTSIAYISSVAQLIAAGVNPPPVPDNNSFYFDSVVFLTLFLLIGRMIEAYSKSKTGDAVLMLGKLRPTEALLVESASSTNLVATEETAHGAGGELLKNINVDLLELGDIARIPHGASPPCDGTVVQGETKFDESSLTGESKLVKKVVGDEVFSGTINKGSPISVKITGVAGSSMLDQIVQAVREGQTRRAPMERIADTLTGYFVPFVTAVAICTWIIWLALGYSGVLPLDYLSEDAGGWVAWSLQFAIAVFVVACPCGLALAAPTALFVGGGLAAKNGILVKGGGEAFEKASMLDCIVFDKTGTLTLGGEPVVTDFRSYPVETHFDQEEDDIKDPKISEQTVLGMISTLEGNSSHTVAQALVSFCNTHEKAAVDADVVDEIAGKGMKGTFHVSPAKEAGMIIGNELLMDEASVPIPQESRSALEKWKSEGRSVALAAVQDIRHKSESDDKQSWQLAAIFAISDPIRPEAPKIIKALHDRGTDVWMLSGDNQVTADAIGRQVGIRPGNVIAGVLPSQKADKIQYLQKSLKARTSNPAKESTQKRAIVAMVGDGINDSPALTTADIGIAIGSGSDIAISSAEFVLVSSNLNTLITLLDLSKFVFRRIKFNFGWALIYNLIALPVAAGVFYPIVSNGGHVRLDPVWASLAMALSSISVVCSSLALRSKIPWLGFRLREAVDG
jgi:heavy metal translocating P-type ATPase